MADARNAYTHDPIAATFARAALPIILLTSVNGLLTVVDAMFLGAFVGPDALTAVTMVFPVSMLMVALATMISTGMASVLGRLLGANGSLRKAAKVIEKAWAAAPHPDLAQVTSELRSALGTKVEVLRGRKGGRIAIDYYSDEDFERLYELLVRAGRA